MIKSRVASAKNLFGSAKQQLHHHIYMHHTAPVRSTQLNVTKEILTHKLQSLVAAAAYMDTCYEETSVGNVSSTNHTAGKHNAEDISV